MMLSFVRYSAVLLVVPAIYFLGLLSFSGASSSSEVPYPLIRDFPVSISRMRQPPAMLGESSIDWLKHSNREVQINDDEFFSPSSCIHLVKCFGMDVELVKAGKTYSAMDVLLDEALSERFFGHVSLVKTRTGLRFPTIKQASMATAGDESHRDQCLESLGEFGVRSSTPITIGDQQFTLRDVVVDALANFQLDQKELAWSVTAFALYMPTSESWSNRFGDEFTFDQCARELMERSIAEASCGGTHRFFCMTLLLQVDEQESIFSPEVRRDAEAFVARAVQCAIQNQEADGSWKLGWNHALFDKDEGGRSEFVDNDRARLVMTGHIAEWLLYLDEKAYRVDPLVLRRSSQWLSVRLGQVSEKEFWGEVCPYTHAFCALRSPQ